MMFLRDEKPSGLVEQTTSSRQLKTIPLIWTPDEPQLEDSCHQVPTSSAHLQQQPLSTPSQPRSPSLPPSASSQPLPSPTSFSDQDQFCVPPPLSDEAAADNEIIFEKVRSEIQKRGYNMAHTVSSASHPEPIDLAMPFRIVSTTQEMFNWHISEGAQPESMQYQAHWLSHLRPHKASEQKIRELTTRTLECLPTSLLCKARAKDTCESYHQISQINWQRFVSDQLFPFSAPSELLLVQLGPDELPWPILGQSRWRGPEFVYCLTDAIFSQRGSKTQNVL